MKNRILPGILAVLMVLNGCAHSRSQNSAVNPAENTNHTQSSSEEASIGQQIHQQILAQFQPYTEPKLVNYVNRVGLLLAGHAERQDLVYQFTILYNEKIYATSSPGGYVYITTGMLYFLQSESELAAVLAHEIGELQYKDPRLSKSKKILDAVTRGGAMVGPAFGTIGALAVLGLVLVNAAAQGREQTPEDRLLSSDVRAMNYMVKAGYDPQGMIEVQQRFLRADKQVTPYFFDYYQSRPITMDRINSLNQTFSKLPLDNQSFAANSKSYQDITQGVREMYQR